jgi:hypothetical protein
MGRSSYVYSAMVRGESLNANSPSLGRETKKRRPGNRAKGSGPAVKEISRACEIGHHGECSSNSCHCKICDCRYNP